MSKAFQAECPTCGRIGFEDEDDWFYHASTCEDCVDDEEDFLSGVTCNPDAPEECESCQ